MKNIGIINCYNVSKRCSSSGCFKALYNETGSFERYKGEGARIISFVHCNGCGNQVVNQFLERAERMVQRGVDVIHLSTCVRSKCPWYDEVMKNLSEKYEIEGYSHAKKNSK
ncbi:CGGC domain-containing protein [Anaerophilus nitritogenes]|uniref:CGGC domain-containing protein n=1 Tax=Anaerophilus nitritogenes TaxID=2498136 RepID=UPI00101C38C8|nr:CGGC domain-containing protein [Anaerophilus nitritogenes]